MIIKSITLKNFRQYQDAKIEFSNLPGKNVTIIMGDNGTGKTTLAQAFQWALYGKTQFQITEVINRITRETMTMGQTKHVSVTLEIIYNETVYTLSRTLAYKKNAAKKIEEGEGKFIISYLDKKTGKSEFIPEYQKNYFIKRVLPQELSKFFFFDGERIEEMSKEMQGGKSDEFKDAVYSLVGLVAQQNAIEHFKPRRGNKKSVLSYFKEQIDKNNKSSEQMNKYNLEIEQLNKELEQLKDDEQSIQNEIENAQKRINQNLRIIMEESDQMEMKERYNKIQREIKVLERKRTEQLLQDIIKPISGNLYDYCMQPVMAKAKELVTDEVPNEKIVPGLTTKTINHLLKERRTCLCGTPLTQGEPAYQSVAGFLEFAYPKTIASLKEDYEKTYRRIDRNKEYFESLTKKIHYREQEGANIEAKDVEMKNLMDMITNTDKGENAKKQNAQLDAMVKQKGQQLVNTRVKIQSAEQRKQRLESEKEKLVIVDDETARNKRYFAYAEYIYNEFFNDYSNLETKYRVKLQNKMNEIFENIYDGNILISVDSKYRIKVKVDEEFASEEEVEKNTAQGYALIFAFIAAIIDLAKEKVNEDALEESEKIDVEKEGYPLVMDAPLSAFDKTRIKKICYEIPRIADQVIMFIKDTDGEIAEEHMSSKIGKRYLIEKVENSSLNSKITERR